MVVHGSSVAGEKHPPSNRTEHTREFPVIVIGHLKAVRCGVTAGIMDVWGIEIENRSLGVISPNDFDSWCILNLHTLEALYNLRKALYGAKPS